LPFSTVRPEEKARIIVANGPGMTIFSPDGKYGYVCSAFTPGLPSSPSPITRLSGRSATSVLPQYRRNTRRFPGLVHLERHRQGSGLRCTGAILALEDARHWSGTNHVNIVRNPNGMFACHSGRFNEVQVYRTDDFPKLRPSQGKLPHGIWPPVTARVYVGLENEDQIAAIDTLANKVIATSPIGQAPRQSSCPMLFRLYGTRQLGNDEMPVAQNKRSRNLQPLAPPGNQQLWLAPPGLKAEKAPTSVSLSDQGLVQVLEASGTGLKPGKAYVLALSTEPSGAGALEPLQSFMANPAGSAIVNAIGPIRQIVRDRQVAAALSGDRAWQGRKSGPPGAGASGVIVMPREAGLTREIIHLGTNSICVEENDYVRRIFVAYPAQHSCHLSSRWHRGHDSCCRPVRHDRFCGSAIKHETGGYTRG
jgi:YVTN family beta-propeller protein